MIISLWLHEMSDIINEIILFVDTHSTEEQERLRSAYAETSSYSTLSEEYSQ